MKEIFDSRSNDLKQTHLQLELAIDIPITERVYTPNPRWDCLENTTYDPYWETLEDSLPIQQQNSNSCDILDQTNVISVGNFPANPTSYTENEIFSVSAHQHKHPVGEQLFIESDELAPFAHQQCFCVGEQVIDVTNLHISESIVGEQVKHHTQKLALPNDQPAHWIERYWVQRGGNKYWYHRYTWMAGRKMHRVYIGSTRSRQVQEKVELVREAIALGMSPSEIKQLINGEYD